MPFIVLTPVPALLKQQLIYQKGAPALNWDVLDSYDKTILKNLIIIKNQLGQSSVGHKFNTVIYSTMLH